MLTRTLTSLTRLARSGVLVAFTALLAVALVDGLGSRRLPDLSLWHRIDLVEEFARNSADRPGPGKVADFSAYLALEERLFDELERRVIAPYQPRFSEEMNRYVPASISSPSRFAENYNHSYELVPQRPRGAILLLHGLTDSPYSLHHLGRLFYRLNFHVVALRLPGHGTIPAALTDVQWEDWAAATRLALARASELVQPGQPLYVAGYSTGAAIALDSVADDLLADAETRIDRLLLFSPAIGVSPVAQLANMHRLVARIPGFEKAPWASVIPEFDPFKYQSFTKNGAWQVRRLTSQLKGKLAALFNAGATDDFPAVLAMMSVVDATVSVQSVVDLLMQRLPFAQHEMMLFDINHQHRALGYLRPAIDERLDRLFHAQPAAYRRTLLSNRDTDSFQVAEMTYRADGQVVTVPTEWRWPVNVFSLSHIALLFPEDDPLYGVHFRPDRLSLGALDLKGEIDMLQLADGQLMRLRYNPFYSYIEQRLAALVAEDTAPERDR